MGRRNDVLRMNGFEDGVGDGGGFTGRRDFVDAEDVGPGEDGGGVGGDGGSGGAGRLAHGGGVLSGEIPWQETFAGDAGEDGEAEGVEIGEVGEEGEVFGAEFAEAEAGVEDDLIAGQAGGSGCGDAFG